MTQLKEVEPRVVTFVTPNIAYLTKIQYLTGAEKTFLFGLTTLLNPENCINKEGDRYITQNEIGQRLKLSRGTTNQLINSLEQKGLLEKELNIGNKENNARYKIFVNPNILFFDEVAESVPEWLHVMFKKQNSGGSLKDMPFKF